jgi:hypothetical protein
MVPERYIETGFTSLSLSLIWVLQRDFDIRTTVDGYLNYRNLIIGSRFDVSMDTYLL